MTAKRAEGHGLLKTTWSEFLKNNKKNNYLNLIFNAIPLCLC